VRTITFFINAVVFITTRDKEKGIFPQKKIFSFNLIGFKKLKEKSFESDRKFYQKVSVHFQDISPFLNTQANKAQACAFTSTFSLVKHLKVSLVGKLVSFSSYKNFQPCLPFVRKL
jgi:hypothetical protein